MESVKKLEKSISSYKVALKASKNEALKKKLSDKIKAAEQEIEKLKAKSTKKIPKPKKKSGLSMSNAKRFAEAKKKRAQQPPISLKKEDIEKDAKRPALPKGYRISKNGNKYWEGRENRIDRRPARYARLEKGGSVDRYNVSFNYNPSNLSHKEAEKIASAYTRNWRHDNDFDEASFFVMGLSKSDADSLMSDLKMENAYNVEVDKSRYEDGGMMADGGQFNYGRSWTMDRRGHNQKEDYEIPMSDRKMAMGGVIDHGLRFGDLIVGLDSSSVAKVKNTYDNQMYLVDVSKGERTPTMGEGGEMHRSDENMM